MDETGKMLIGILRSALNGWEGYESVAEAVTPDILKNVYSLAKKHDLTHIISRFVHVAKCETGSALLETLEREEVISVYRCEQIQHTLSEICQILDAAQIAYIPLKGAVLRDYYPDAHMRTSCDIDVLIHKKDLDEAISQLEKQGFQFLEKRYHDAELCSPAGVHLELHFSVCENMRNLDAVLQDVWKYATPSSGSQFQLVEEFFVFYIFAHAAYHFLRGGCGIRTLTDVWIMEHKMKMPFSAAEALLEKAGILTFAAEVSALANKCFSQEEVVYTDPVFQYIVSGGVYGNQENHLAVKMEQTGNAFGYTLKRLFLPYMSMSASYPTLKKMPFLLPVFWVMRWCKAILKRKQILSEFSAVTEISAEETEKIKEIRTRLGL